MKPSKSKRFCANAGKQKVVFETEKKAMNFIKFNADEIKAESGYSPTRAYYCISCGGYHVTSRKEGSYFDQKDQEWLDAYDSTRKKMDAHYKKMMEQKKIW